MTTIVQTLFAGLVALLATMGLTPVAWEWNAMTPGEEWVSITEVTPLEAIEPVAPVETVAPPASPMYPVEAVQPTEYPELIWDQDQETGWNDMGGYVVGSAEDAIAACHNPLLVPANEASDCEAGVLEWTEFDKSTVQ